MSPQAIRLEQDDTRGDIYSLGAVLYELLTGQVPYQGTSTAEVCERILAGPPRSIRDLNPKANAALAALADKAMARELRDRYAHLSYLLEDVAAIQRGESPRNLELVAPVPRTGDVCHRKKRRALVLGTIAIGVLAMLAGLTKWKSALSGRPVAAESLQCIRKIQLPGIWNWSKAVLSEFAHRGTKIILPHEETLLVVSTQGHLEDKWQAPFHYIQSFRFLMRTNVNRDPIIETVVTYQALSNVFISILNDTPIEIHRLSYPSAMTARPTGVECDSSVNEATWANLLGNNPLLLCIVGTGYQLRPRGLLCFDLASQSMRWQRLTGPFLVGVSCLDLDGDGQLEIICGSDAANNGNKAEDGTSDEYAYLFAFNARGESLWIKQLGDIYNVIHPLITDLDGDGHQDLVAWLECGFDLRSRLGLPEIGRIHRFNAQGEIIASFDTGGISLVSCLAADLNGDQKPEILATDVHGRVHCLDASLLPQKAVQIVPPAQFPIRLELWAVADINGDQRPELIFHSSQPEFISGTNPGDPAKERPVRFFHQIELLFSDQDFKPLTRYPIAAKLGAEIRHAVAVADMDEDGQNEVVYLGEEVWILKWKAAE